MRSQSQKAVEFSERHTGPGILVLPNAWDAGSAILMVQAGFSAIATTSAGIAFAAGLPDGQRITRDRMLRAVAEIVAAVDVPVTADLEGGYGRTPEDVARTVTNAIEAGAVGCNIEDGSDTAGQPLLDLELACDRIRAGAEAASGSVLPFTLNARTDPFLARDPTDPTNFSEAVRRANAYRAAGANCLFVPGVKDRAIIAELVREIDGPLNILAASGGSPSPLSVADLVTLRVKRISIGSSLSLAALAVVQRAARELKEHGTFTYTATALSHSEANRLMQEGHA